jgi:bacillithiol biosynthesis cysteine-adding enzyme BshC
MSIVSQFPLTSIPGFSRLVADYLKAKPALRHLYNYDLNLDSFAQIMSDKPKEVIDRKLLVSVLNKQYESVNVTAATRRNIDSLAQSNTYTITAAHQPCVLLGPVFNIYKIASTINLTQQLKAKYPDQNFVPVFWMGSEDHDFEELGTTNIYGKKIEWPAQAGEAGAYGRRKLDSFHTVLDEATQILGDSSKDLIDKLRSGLSTFKTFGPYTRFLINELFGEFGLVVIDQDDAALKKQFSPVIADEVKHSSAIKALDDNLKWLTANYSVQATPRGINLFYLSDNSRERIIRTDEGFEVNNTSIRFTAQEMEELVNTKPELFSPNVILRPVYQEMILPNLAFIGGAGELSYWLELKPVFEHHKVNYPALIQRASVTVLSSSIQKKLDKLGLKPEKFFEDIEDTIKCFVKAKLSDEVQLGAEKQQIESLFNNIATKAEVVDPTLKGAVLAEKQKQLNAIEALEGRILKAEKRKQEEAIAQIRAVHQTITPDGNWQERVENFLTFYSKDPNFVREIVSIADPMEQAMIFLQ